MKEKKEKRREGRERRGLKVLSQLVPRSSFDSEVRIESNHLTVQWALIINQSEWNPNDG